jgi:hypothetical protein
VRKDYANASLLAERKYYASLLAVRKNYANASPLAVGKYYVTLLAVRKTMLMLVPWL